MTILETKHFLLRQLVSSDAETLFNIYQKDDVMKYMLYQPINLEQEQQNILQIMAMYQEWGFGLWGTVFKENNQLVGRCGLYPWSFDGQPDIEIAYVLDKSYWGKGYGTEITRGIVKYALQTLGLTRLITLIHRRNQAALRIAVKLGMDFERTKRLENKLISLYALDVKYSGMPEYLTYI